MNPTKIIPEEDQKRVMDASERLMEHFDSVRIFVTRHDGSSSETASFEYGGGNFYAQLGQISEWVSMQDQYQRNYASRSEGGGPDKDEVAS